jgi:hypothetical protein
LFAGPCKIIKASIPIWSGGPCGPGVGVSPPQIEFYQANPLQGATFVSWPPPNSQSKYPVWLGGPCGPGVGVSPPQITFHLANPPRGAAFVCWPPPNSLPFREFQMGSVWEVPPGADILGRPLAWCRARVK